MFLEKVTTERVEIPIEEITLLSVEEAEHLSDDVLACEDDWWLRSPGETSHFVAFVEGPFHDYVNTNGTCVDIDYGVRPALRVHPLHENPYGVRTGDTVILFGHKWTVISDTLILCNDLVGETVFRKNNEAEDANQYEVSDIKRWLELWYAKNLMLTDGTHKSEDVKKWFKHWNSESLQRIVNSCKDAGSTKENDELTAKVERIANSFPWT